LPGQDMDCFLESSGPGIQVGSPLQFANIARALGVNFYTNSLALYSGTGVR
jgi:hypothetical protein